MIDVIVAAMAQLQQLHESLLALSKKKTEALKNNETTVIQELLAAERKHIQAIEKVEKKRLEHVAGWYEQNGHALEQPTISEMIELTHGEEQQKLQEAYEAFILVLADLKYQEELNAELTKQSLQFINLSMDMLQPSLKSMNYNSGAQKPANTEQKRSVFDSKA
ncbi:flagellar protein FlgN [Halobacillus salinarum]|uniref:Flagellar protein FlgN n=1 Tax=Halobacillus salinarum TaxID=2932257 RepID=A0ABY4EP10_9BACI|nr:flagellar protein FlgN [Halobacillus salinarum]UOQ45725.1 flagellar protein FlgN [Halobacillus salinarum]